jgi:hypothetical protein
MDGIRIARGAMLPGVTDDQQPESCLDKAWSANYVLSLKSAFGTWRKVATELAPFCDRSASAWLAVSHGDKLTMSKFNALRRHAGLEPLPTLVHVEPCPDCGSVHHARCNGIADPVVIVKCARPQSPAWVLEAAAWLRQHENHASPVLRSYTRQGKPVR